MALVVYNNSDRACQIKVTQDGQLLDFTAITRMVLTFRESSIIADTDSNPDLITWDSEGVIVFSLGHLGLDLGAYTGLLIAYDPAHINGQVISHPDDNARVIFNVIGALNNSALIVQSDAGDVENANAYHNVEYFISYHRTRGRLIIRDTEEIEVAIIKARDYMDSRFNYKGFKLVDNQTTEFPREDVYDAKGNAVLGIPREAKQASAEYAYIALDRDLDPTPEVNDNGSLVQSKSEKVGPISESVTYAVSTGAIKRRPAYPIADQKLYKAGLITSNKGWIH